MRVLPILYGLKIQISCRYNWCVRGRDVASGDGSIPSQGSHSGVEEWYLGDLISLKWWFDSTLRNKGQFSPLANPSMEEKGTAPQGTGQAPAVITPTVGRMVYYKSYGTPNGEYKSVDRAAVITEVVDAEAEIVSLCVLNPTGFFFNQNLKRGQEGGQWDWMPFQKGQAQKTEELEKKLAEKE